jgi:hypothetical protein
MVLAMHRRSSFSFCNQSSRLHNTYVILIWLGLISSSSVAIDTEPLSKVSIPPTFFGLHMHKPIIVENQPWPTIPFGAARLWDCGVYWAQINTSKGVYDWSLLDKWLNKYHEHGIDDLMYTFGRVPRWASPRPNAPPDDLRPDGTGTDQHWKDFVSAIANHSKSSHGARIRYWEVWNEPFMEDSWTGTNPQLVRMEQDASTVIKGIDPNAVIVSPPGAMKTPKQQEWMESYLHDGGGKNVDVIGLHGYIHNGRPGSRPVAADIIPAVKALRRMLEARGMGSMTIFDTEASWGRASGMGFENDEEFEAGFLAQFFLLHWSSGVSRFYWYAWNNDEFGTLWSPDPASPSRPGRLHKAGFAYKQVYEWMVGATMNSSCSSSENGIWTCGFTRPGGYEALAVWSTGGDKSYAANTKFKKARDLEGNTSSITDGKVNIGFKPILLQNR